MREQIRPARRIRGFMRVPGDKSISHRYAMLGAIASGVTRIRNYSTGADCWSTLECLRALGVPIESTNEEVIIHGAGPGGLVAPSETLDAGNSGSTIRMLSGILAGQSFTSLITGDASLLRRPMDRIIVPLRQMGATIRARQERYPPLEIQGGNLQGIDYTLPVPSAQVKTCVLLAGLFADGYTVVREPVPTRDHTEIALRQFGAQIEVINRIIRLRGHVGLQGQTLLVPGDLSSAAFFLVAALIVPDSELVIEGVGLNPTRSELLDFLISMGADIRVRNVRQQAGELLGELQVRSSDVSGGRIEKARTAALIDEIPILAVLGAVSREGLEVRDAAELQIKETDRIATIAENCRRMGVAIEVLPDGFIIPGRQKFRAAEFHSFGDHRIAMAMAVAALCADGECSIEAAEAADVSFPGFFEALRAVVVL